jgi:hypothetical protein
MSFGVATLRPQSCAQASPILHIADPVMRALLAAGSTGNDGYNDYVVTSKTFAVKLRLAGTHVEFMSIAGAAHKDTVAALGDEHSELSHAAIRLISGN